MELFDDLGKLYSQLLKDVDYLNICASRPPSHNIVQQNGVVDALHEDLTDMQHLKVSMVTVPI